MVTTVDDFRLAQQGRAAHHLFSLFMSCRRKFLNAARLLELRGAAVQALEKMGGQTVHLQPLLSMYTTLCERYIEAFLSPQGRLFEEEPAVEWGRYFHRTLVPHLLLDDGFVRNVLRAMGGLPCRDPGLAMDALVQHVSEMTLPETPPLWAPEDRADL